MQVEERAKENSNICKTCIQTDGTPDSGCMECENRGYYYGYIEGAKEQKEIDIQKAVEFLKNEVDVKDHFRYTKEWYIEELTKAMKGE